VRSSAPARRFAFDLVGLSNWFVSVFNMGHTCVSSVGTFFGHVAEHLTGSSCEQINERSISHKLAEHLLKAMPEEHGLDIDCEYDRLASI
jgi:hypothetical protein